MYIFRSSDVLFENKLRFIFCTFVFRAINRFVMNKSMKWNEIAKRSCFDKSTIKSNLCLIFNVRKMIEHIFFMSINVVFFRIFFIYFDRATSTMSTFVSSLFRLFFVSFENFLRSICQICSCWNDFATKNISRLIHFDLNISSFHLSQIFKTLSIQLNDTNDLIDLYSWFVVYRINVVEFLFEKTNHLRHIFFCFVSKNNFIKFINVSFFDAKMLKLNSWIWSSSYWFWIVKNISLWFNLSISRNDVSKNNTSIVDL